MRTFLNHLSVLGLLSVGLLATAPAKAATAQRPNILIVIADDCSHNDLPLYGGQNVRTPNIDRLTREGLTFNRAFLCIAMCNPCRTELYTGLYPARSGSCWNHSTARPNTRSICHHLGALGYRVGLAGKKHVSGKGQPFPFEDVPGLERSCVATTARFDEASLRTFMTRDRTQPFCLVTALVVPHAPWTVGDPSHFKPKELRLPPNLADTPATRQDFAKYLAEIEVLDQQVGRLLALLDETDFARNTLVIFTSEQGSQFPGNKWTDWNTGVHTAFVARWPGNVAAGKRTDAIIQYNDVVPTLVEVAGGEVNPADFDGSSFRRVLLGETDTHRRFAYFMHNNIPEGPPYPIRSVTDGRYHYIRNLRPEAIYIEKHLMGQNQWHQYWPTWVVDATFNARTRRLVTRYLRRPPEQLYRMDQDPFELRNLARDAAHAEAKARLSKELDRWMRAQGDPGAVIDSREQWQAARRGEHFRRR